MYSGYLFTIEIYIDSFSARNTVFTDFSTGSMGDCSLINVVIEDDIMGFTAFSCDTLEWTFCIPGSGWVSTIALLFRIRGMLLLSSIGSCVTSFLIIWLFLKIIVGPSKSATENYSAPTMTSVVLIESFSGANPKYAANSPTRLVSHIILFIDTPSKNILSSSSSSAGRNACT